MIKKIGKIINKNNQKKIFVFVCLFLFVFIFVNTPFANAATNMASDIKSGALGGIGTGVQLIIGWIAYILVSVLSLITTVLISLLVNVAQFSDIIDVPIVVQGWVIIRDLCNMFFVLALLVIAFATILKLENYSAKRLLPKLLIMAVVINFSKMIFGLMVDASQVVMLTFVNGFAAGGGHLVTLFKMDKFLTAEFGKAAFSAGGGLSPWATTLSIIAAFFAAIMTLVVVAVILAVLVMRIVFLWIYTMLSPLAFLGFAFPPIQGYTRQIWEDFVKQLVVGPVLAFFLWLALTAASKSAETLGSIGDKDSALCAGASAFFCDKDLQVYLLTVGLLLGGLRFAQQMGGDIAKVAGKAEAFTKKGVGKITRDPLAYAGRGIARKIGQKAGSGALSVVHGLAGDSGIGTLAKNWNKNLKTTRQENKEKAMLKFQKKIGMGESARKSLGQIADSKTMRKVKESSKIIGGAALAAIGNPLAMIAGAGVLWSAKKSVGSRHGRDKYDETEKDRENKTNASKSIMEDNINNHEKNKNENIEKARQIRDEKVNSIPGMEDILAPLAEKELKAEEKKRRDIDKAADKYKIGTFEFEEALKKIKTEFEQEMSNIHVEFDAQIDIASNKDKHVKKVEDEFNKKKKDFESAFDKVKKNEENNHQIRLVNLDGDKVRKAKIKAFNTRNKKIKKIESGFNEKVSDEKLDYNNVDHRVKIDQYRSEASLEKIKTKKEYEDKIKELNNPYIKHSDYHPNSVLMGAYKRSEEASNTAAKRKKALADGGGEIYGAGTLYSEDGQTAVQKKLFELLSESDEGSVQAISNLEKTMKKFLTSQQNGVKLSEREASSVKAWKQGLAASDKGGVNTVTFAPVIEIINQIKAKGEDTPQTVDDYKEKIIPAS